jgi:hypothetical protein
MVRWLLIQLNAGSYDGKQLWSADVSSEMQEPQITISANSEYALLLSSAGFRCYGFGWFLYTYAGQKVVEHQGQTDGMQALVSLLPGKKLGIVVLTNTNKIGLAEALAYRWYDQNLDMPVRHWSTEFLASLTPINQSMDLETAKRDSPHVLGTQPSVPFDHYTGLYRDDLLGDVNITMGSNNRLIIKLLGRTGELSHWNYDTCKADWNGDVFLTWTVPFVKFDLGFFGDVEKLTLSSGDNFTRAGNGGRSEVHR